MIVRRETVLLLEIVNSWSRRICRVLEKFTQRELYDRTAGPSVTSLLTVMQLIELLGRAEAKLRTAGVQLAADFCDPLHQHPQATLSALTEQSN